MSIENSSKGSDVKNRKLNRKIVDTDPNSNSSITCLTLHKNKFQNFNKQPKCVGAKMRVLSDNLEKDNDFKKKLKRKNSDENHYERSQKIKRSGSNEAPKFVDYKLDENGKAQILSKCDDNRLNQNPEPKRQSNYDNINLNKNSNSQNLEGPESSRINNNYKKKLKRKILVLDLDETLVHGKYNWPGKPVKTYKKNQVEYPPDFVFVSLNFTF